MKHLIVRLLLLTGLSLSLSLPLSAREADFTTVKPGERADFYAKLAADSINRDIISTAYAHYLKASRNPNAAVIQKSMEIADKPKAEPMILLSLATYSGAKMDALTSATDMANRDQVRFLAKIYSVVAQSYHYSSMREGYEMPLNALNVPAALLQSKDRETAAAAMLAAAYARNFKNAEVIAAIESKDGALGARMVFEVLNGGTIDKAALDAAFEAPTRGVVDEPEKLLGAFGLLPDKLLACEAIKLANFTNAATYAARALTDEDLRTQIMAAETLKALGEVRAAAPLAKRLNDCPWQVLVPVCDALGTLPEKRVIPGIMKRLQREKGRFREDCIYALSSMTGRKVGSEMKDWVDWYRSDFEDFEIDPAAMASFREANKITDMVGGTNISFYGRPITSDRFTYLFDTTSSMRGNRIFSVRKSTFETIRNFPPHIAFNIINFDNGIKSLSERELIRDRKAGAMHVLKMPIGTDKHDVYDITRSLDAILLAMRLPELDTIYMVTDSIPYMSRLDDYGATRQSWALLTRFNPIRLVINDMEAANTQRHTSMNQMTLPEGGGVMVFDPTEAPTDPRFVLEGDAKE